MQWSDSRQSLPNSYRISLQNNYRGKKKIIVVKYYTELSLSVYLICASCLRDKFAK